MQKIIHYCWFGGAEKSDIINKCIESWHKFCPDFEIKEWNETNFDVIVVNTLNKLTTKKNGLSYLTTADFSYSIIMAVSTSIPMWKL